MIRPDFYYQEANLYSNVLFWCLSIRYIRELSVIWECNITFDVATHLKWIILISGKHYETITLLSLVCFFCCWWRSIKNVTRKAVIYHVLTLFWELLLFVFWIMRNKCCLMVLVTSTDFALVSILIKEDRVVQKSFRR